MKLTNLLLEGESASTGGNIAMIIILIGLVVLMLVLPSITQKKRIKEYKEMQSSLRPGDKVQTIGGIVGKIVKLKEKDGFKTVLLETGDNKNKMIIEFNIDAIGGKVEGLVNPNAEVSNANASTLDENNQSENAESNNTETATAEEKEVEESNKNEEQTEQKTAKNTNKTKSNKKK